MRNRIGIRREDKNRFEKRAPLSPEHVMRLVNDHDVEFCVQSSELRIYPDEEYESKGATVSNDISDCDVILGVKEVSTHDIIPDRVYMFFSHTIKGQKKNMEMLRKMVEKKTTLIDFEKIVDETGRRLIFFGWHAGAAGLIDTLWALGRRLEWEGVRNPFSSIMPAHEYGNLPEAREHIASVGRLIGTYGIPYSIRPLVVGITGYGNVSKGAQEILDLMPVKVVHPEELPNLRKRADAGNSIYKVVFEESDMVETIDPDAEFDLQDYYDHPEKYRSKFHNYIPYLTMMLNCIYWEPKYPRLLTKDEIRGLYSDIRSPKLRVIGDISCDIEGAVESTLHSTTTESPTFVYDPWEDKAVPGWKGTGPVIMAVDNLPCEIPRASTEHFGDSLKDFIPSLSRADFSADLEDLELPGPVKNGIILYKGEFTDKFSYMRAFIERES